MKKFLIPSLIIIVAALLRFVTIAKLVPFTPDEEYLIYLANTIIKDFHIIWIGVSSLGFDLYMGPFWIYFITPFLIFSRGDPIILNYLAITLGLGAIALLYFLGEKLFSKRVALVACLMYAVSPLMVFYDQKAYPSGIPILSLLLAGTIYMTKSSKWWWVAFSFFYGLVFHLHLSLILIIFVALYWALTHKKTLNLKIVAISIITFALTVSPLIAFDYFHKGSNITAPIRVINSIKTGGAPKINLAPRLNAFLESLGRIFYLPRGIEASDEIIPTCPKSKAPLIISIASFFALSIFFLNKKTWKHEGKRLIASLSLAFIVPFTILPIINPVEYYLLGFFPLLFLIIAATIDSFPKTIRNFLYIFLLILGIYGVTAVVTANGSFGLASQKHSISKVMNIIGDNSFEISEEGGCHKYVGWRYLFKAYGKTPAKSSEDYNFSWLYPGEVSVSPVKYTVIMKEDRNLPGFSFQISRH